MANKRRKKKKYNRSKNIVRIIKSTLFLLVLLLPCVWLMHPAKKESEPMRVARAFAHHMIHGEYNEACAIATPQSVDDIKFYATWIGEQLSDLQTSDVRFKITHAQQYLPSDTTNMIYGQVIIIHPEGDVSVLYPLELRMVDSIDGWLVDYKASADMWL